MKTRDIRRHRKQVREFQRITGALQGDRMCCAGVSVPQCHVLLELDESGRTSLIGVAETLGLDTSTVSRTVDGLVKLGLVDRTPDPDDRRYVVLDLTEAGRKTVAVIHEVNDDGVRRVFELIPHERRADVVECFGLLVNAAASLEKGREER
jgi:DNA-binding MarR family transcriptional regulator